MGSKSRGRSLDTLIRQRESESEWGDLPSEEEGGQLRRSSFVAAMGSLDLEGETDGGEWERLEEEERSLDSFDSVEIGEEDTPPLSQGIASQASKVVTGNNWIRCFAVVEFDIDFGQKVKQTVPANALCEREQDAIRMLSMPECHAEQEGDAFYCFRRRASTALPLYATSALEQEYEYCFVLFRQYKCEALRRGFFQQSVVVVSKFPFYSLFRYITFKLGPLFFEHGDSLLEAAYSIINNWPSHVCGKALELPFLGEVVKFKVPDVKCPALVPSVNKDLAHQHCDHFTLKRSKVGGEEETKDARVMMEGGEGAGGVMPSQAPSNFKEVLDASSHRSGIEDGCGGLFQNIGLYRTFLPVLDHLWVLWEKVLTGEPIMVVAPDAPTCSVTVLGLVSLISPIYYAGDFRPYFSTYDGDFVNMQKSHDACKGVGGFPATIIGVTNPFFFKTFSCWQNAVRIPAGAYAQSNGNKTERILPGSRGSRPVQVISETAVLESGIPTSGKDQPIVICRQEPLMRPNVKVLSKLHRLPHGHLRSHSNKRLSASDIKKVNDNTLRRHFQHLTLAFLTPFEQYFEINMMGGRDTPTKDKGVSAGMKLFRLLQSSETTKSSTSFRIGLYDDPEKYLKAFDEDSFMSELRRTGPPVAFREVRWTSLYKRFIRSPNFRPWFNTRRIACASQVRSMCRAACMTVDGDALLRNSVSDGKGYLSDTEMIQLLLRIRRAIDDEQQSVNPDKELCAQMARHRGAIEKAMAPTLLEAVNEMVRTPAVVNTK